MEYSLYFVSEDKARRSGEFLGMHGFELQKLGWSRANDSYYVVVRKPVQPEEAEPLLRVACKRFGGVYKDYFSETGQIIKPK
jgi:hypothetical protein